MKDITKLDMQLRWLVRVMEYTYKNIKGDPYESVLLKKYLDQKLDLVTFGEFLKEYEKELDLLLTKVEAEVEINGIIDAYPTVEIYTKDESDVLLDKKADKTSLDAKADKTELEAKADKSSVYTKLEVYTKGEDDAKLNLKLDASIINQRYDTTDSRGQYYSLFPLLSIWNIEGGLVKIEILGTRASGYIYKIWNEDGTEYANKQIGFLEYLKESV